MNPVLGEADLGKAGPEAAGFTKSDAQRVSAAGKLAGREPAVKYAHRKCDKK